MAFTVQHQEATNWCWAALAASVGATRQSKVVENNLGATNCDLDPKSSACNRPFYLDLALQDLPRSIDTKGPLLLQQVKNQLATNPAVPICVKIDWKNGGAHYVAIVDVTGTNMLVIEDPKNGHQIPCKYTTFKTNYRRRGTWSETYLLL
jgi:hypothetical protein